MKINGNHIIADRGKVFRRIADGTIYGNEIYLGNTYYIGGVLLDPPHADTADDFEEICDDADLTDSEALRIITGGANDETE